MKRFLAIFVVLMTLCGTSELFGQAKFGFGAQSVYQNKDTVDLTMGDSTVTFSMWVLNKGDQEYSGPLLLMFKYQYGGNPNGTAKFVKNVNEFQPGDSIFWEYTDTVRMPPYAGGDNIIVIWPPAVSPDYVVTDSSYNNVHVIGLPASRNPIKELDSRLGLFPNPASDHLFLDHKSDISKFEYVRIRDMEGRLVFESDQALQMINVSNFRPGIFFVEVRYSDGISGVLKFLHMN